MTPSELMHVVERRVLIRARVETVFRYFTDSQRWASWWGPGSTIEPRPGGRVFIRHPNAVEVSGQVLEIDPPRRIVYTIGLGAGHPQSDGGSRVTIELAPDPGGTVLHLRHAFDEAEVRDHHVQGWRYQLAVFANRVADDALAGADLAVDAWFAAWSEPDASRRSALLASAVAGNVRFRDRFSHVDGLADLEPHLAAVHIFMPGTRLARAGGVRQCQGTALADWVGTQADGAEMGRGTNVFRFDADGRIEDVVGIWGG
jgi:uncharacterized protein YndB with AHSA1/START domain